MGKTEFTLGILNGAIGDYLSRTSNGLATEMGCFKNGAEVSLQPADFAANYPEVTPRVVLLVHGLMCTERIWTFPNGDDYGALLARDFGYTPLYVRYNSGLAIPDNGHKLAQLLESVLDVYPSPLEEILLIGYSMGGLVVRSACHTANLEGKRWLELVRRAIYVGTPHRGVPLERAGRVLSRLLHEIGDPYTRLVAELGDLRSSGVKDLGNAVLRHEDRIEKSLSLLDPRHPAALLPQLRHYLVAGAVVNKPLLRSLFGDAVVSISSATDGCAELRPPGFASGGVKVVGNIGHLALAHHPQVYEQIRAWCQECS